MTKNRRSHVLSAADGRQPHSGVRLDQTSTNEPAAATAFRHVDGNHA